MPVTELQREKQREANRRSYYKHVEKRRAYYRELSAKRYAADPEGRRKYIREWMAAARRREGVPVKVFNTPEVAKAKHAAQYARWAKANPHMPAALAAKRRAIKRHATPKWAGMEAIKLIYEKAARMTLETGIAHEVDHYYPLRGEVVCGLHCEQNLQVITAVENMRKGNKCP